MNKCRNPECQKEIPENKKYCNEKCLKKHIEIKKQNKKTLNTPLSTLRSKPKETESKPMPFLEITQDSISEVKEICDYFGFKHTDGLVSGSHNATILGYLRQNREGVYSVTVDKLTWICHMSARSLKENYLQGIEAFGIIETFINEFGVIKWKWVGIKALRNNGS